MKIRTGFVSNSSSSSFVAVIKKDAFDRELERAHPYIKAVVEAKGYDDRQVFGYKTVVFRDYSDAGGCSSWDYSDVPAPEDYDGQLPTFKGWAEEKQEPESAHEAFHEIFLASFSKDEMASFSVDF